MSIPNVGELLLPVLKVLADGTEHRVDEIRDRMRNQFDVTSSEFVRKTKTGVSVFVNRVAWALAHLNTEAGHLGHSKAVVLIEKGVYKISEHGTAILKANPSHLTIEDLSQWSERLSMKSQRTAK